MVCQQLEVSILHIPHHIASHFRCKRACSKTPGIVKMSIVKALIREGRQQESNFWSQYVKQWLYVLCTDQWYVIQYLVPIVSLFQGQLINKPEQSMLKMHYSTGGCVEHEVSMSFHLCKSYN